MSAEKKKINKLAIIAGGGNMPARLISSCEKSNIEVFIIAFEGHTNPEIVKGHNHLWINFSKAAQILKCLKTHAIRDVVFIGAIARPALSEIRPNFETLALLLKIGFKSMGDDGLLKSIKKIFEDEGFVIHGVHEFASELLACKGVLGSIAPPKNHYEDIKRGIEVARAVGLIDVGQSVIVQDGIVLGVEAIEGTDELIKRCGSLSKTKKKGVMVKLCKPQQDMNLDMPTIGLDTIKNISKAGFKGIIIEAGRSLIIDEEEVMEFADKNGIYIFGAEIDADGTILNLR